MDEWHQADCRGAATLAEAASKALQYELASRGVKEGAEVVSEDLRALYLIESVLEPAPSRGEEALGVTEVALPEQLRETIPNGRGFRMGELQIIFEPMEGPPHSWSSVGLPPYPLPHLRRAVPRRPRARRAATQLVDVAAQA